MTYLITFACYGCHLHGSASGSVDRHHNQPGTPAIPQNQARIASVKVQMVQEAYTLHPICREAVLNGILQGCAHRHWTLLAAHVRSNHVHVVVEAECEPEPVMNALKSYASRELNALRLDDPNRKRWARHGSTRWLWTPESVAAAVHYVTQGQGAPMSVYPSVPRD